MNKQQGFTLIELVMVIVVLGVLAAFAVPRFADITTDARVATVNAVAGSIRSASALAHATSLAQSRSSGASISMEGTQVTMINFYPTSSPTASPGNSLTGGIAAALADITGFTLNLSGTADTIHFRRIGAVNEVTCYAAYRAAVSTTTTPTISVDTTGC